MGCAFNPHARVTHLTAVLDGLILIDFASTRRKAYGLIGELVAGEGREAEPLQACALADRPLFARFERGEITRAEYRARRFVEPFERLRRTPRDGLVEEINCLFMDCVNDTPTTTPCRRCGA